MKRRESLQPTAQLRLRLVAWLRRACSTSRGAGSRSPTRTGSSSRAGRDEARPDAVLPRGRRAVATRRGGRPTLMQRFPHGAEGSSFFQKRVPSRGPSGCRRRSSARRTARPRAHSSSPTWRTSSGPSISACLGFHVAISHDRPTRRRAAPRPRPAARGRVRRGARRGGELRGLLDELGLVGRPKTTGNRGLHVYVRLEPRWDSYQVRAAAVAVARELERRRPDLITSAWWKEERGRRVFVDFNQNAPHKTVFGAWSVRARPGAQVSAPFAWDELDTIHPDELRPPRYPANSRRG